jgi:type II secretory pathway predicted ATPase ExeA
MLHFLLRFLNEAPDPASSIYKHIGIAVSHDDHSKFIDDVKEQLLACGGMYQLLLFLMGPAGAGKTTVIRAAEQFCYELCLSCNILRLDTSFFYKAYTGSAAPAFGGGTNIKASD